MPDFFYPFPPLYPGILLKRYKRFLADIELETGEIITAHCPNTGPMSGVNIPGNRVLVSKSDNPNRALAYTWELIEINDTTPTWVGTNTALPNRVIKAALQAHAIPELDGYTEIRAEVKYGQDSKSRIDFLLTAPDAETPPTYVEVKNTTWTKETLALFPDTVTTRGQKHLQELTALLPDKQAVMLYYINRDDCTHFAPGDVADAEYGRLFREAIAKGVQILPCRFKNTPLGITYLGLAELSL
ncbi:MULTISPECIES: DNA/RNA nuclease SfsA [unclassified Leptolyngbya]|uniref:DNA/RNA nuclease SfsA n=1 Tax=unclassified Leptolyngbya TaxID=2650499 RepID=UPI0016836DCE|nr:MULTISPECIES: DNA/RNA nuclease SfsA [unclassified Leptolyngbya]MBD1912053.1 DNA/RNA nuclease SfsA [Leptolyngbya sp. FACHB-8]MBD2155423.1 DNA/RNA nuclease SfsA [Leptolyngbya sp. FACHB-16]